jgi:hypothetical protein
MPLRQFKKRDPENEGVVWDPRITPERRHLGPPLGNMFRQNYRAQLHSY